MTGTRKGLWANPKFDWITGSTVSAFGDGLFMVALPWWMLQLTGSARTVTLIWVVTIVARLFFSPFAGVLVDRMSKRTVLVQSGAMGAAMAMMIGLCMSVDRPSVAAILAVVAVMEVAASLFVPALQSSFRELFGVEQLVSANSLLGSAQSMARFGAMAAGEMLLALFGAQVAAYLDAGTFLVSLAGLMCGAFPVARVVRQSRFLPDLWEGLRYTAASPTTLGMVP